MALRYPSGGTFLIGHRMRNNLTPFVTLADLREMLTMKIIAF